MNLPPFRSYIKSLAVGNGVTARVIRSSGSLAVGFAMSQALRLASNLVLTRLLFPEAFGLMALVMVVLTGLVMLSDAGISQSILRHERGDEPEFLNTVWSIQVFRGVTLWVVSIVIAYPVAWFYEEPLLAQLLPVMGLTLLISGFTPTRFESHHRHLRSFRVTMLDLIVQALTIAVIVLLAWQLRSIWALVLGNIIGAIIRLAILHFYLEGHVDRLRPNRPDARDIMGFGKWIVPSSISGFFVNQGDKAILGAYLSIGALGIYSIGYFMGSFPAHLNAAVQSKVLIPLYRQSNPSENQQNARVVRRVRFLLSFAGLTLFCVFAFGGTLLIDFLYDPRYASAGVIVVLIACAQMMGLASSVYDQAALAYGDSRGFFWVMSARALVQTTLLWAGAEAYGIGGAIIGQALALLLTHLGSVVLARKHKCWDAMHDAAVFACAFLVSAVAVVVHSDTIVSLLTDTF